MYPLYERYEGRNPKGGRVGGWFTNPTVWHHVYRLGPILVI